MAKDKKTRLSDIEVEAVGLVSWGANHEPFYLLKADNIQEETVMSDNVQENVTATLTDPERDELRKLVGEILAEHQVQEDETPTETEDLEKQNDIEEAPAGSVEDQLAVLQKSNMALADRLEKAEKLAKEERDLRERAEFLQKAQTDYAQVPVEPSVLAEQLHYLAKMNKDRYDFWSQTLTALVKSVAEGNLFGETGSSEEIDTSDVAKNLDEILKLGDPKQIKDALSKISPVAANAYLKEHRAAIKSS